MQLKHCFKKEWSQFTRTFRLLALVLIFFAMFISYPMLFSFAGSVLNQDFTEIPSTEQAAVISPDTVKTSANDIMSGIDMDAMIDMYSNAGMMFGTTVVLTLPSCVLVVMLLFMSAAGGEQKKRAMIVPVSSGLKYKNYLIPKFIIYPLSAFAITFLSTVSAGVACNVIFPNNHVSAVNMVVAALLAGIYVMFIATVHLSLGLCTSHPGIMAAAIYVGSSVVQSLLQGFGITEYHPFAISSLISDILMMPEYSFADNMMNIVLSIVISIAVCILMFFLALGVLNAKKINNREEIKPEF